MTKDKKSVTASKDMDLFILLQRIRDLEDAVCKLDTEELHVYISYEQSLRLKSYAAEMTDFYYCTPLYASPKRADYVAYAKCGPKCVIFRKKTPIDDPDYGLTPEGIKLWI